MHRQQDDFDDLIDEDIPQLKVTKPSSSRKQQLDFFEVEEEGGFQPTNDKMKLPRLSTKPDPFPRKQSTARKESIKHIPVIPPNNQPHQAQPRKQGYAIEKQVFPAHQQNYQQQFSKQYKAQDDAGDDQDEYHEDFDDFQPEEEVSQSQQKSIKSDLVPPKEAYGHASNTKDIHSKHSVAKLPPRIVKSSTKPAVKPKSREIKRVNSIRSLATNKSQVGPGKYSAEVDRELVEVDLNRSSVDQVTKLNEKVRTMIRKLNSELNIILNKATFEQKKSPAHKTIESVINVLVSEKSNADKILQQQEAELRKFKNSSGPLRDENYEVKLHRDIQQNLRKKKQLAKTVQRLNGSINHGGKRTQNSLSKHNVAALKTELVVLKKEGDRLENTEIQTTDKLNDTSAKNANAQRRFDQLVDEARRKGVSLDGSEQKSLIKHKQMKQKQDALVKHLVNLENLNRTKVQISNSQIQRTHRVLTALDSQIKDVYSQIVDIGDRSSQLVHKEKDNPRILRTVISSLQKICQSIGVLPQFDRVTRVTHRSQSANSQFEKQSEEQSELAPKSPQTSNEQVKKAQPNPFKPNFMKKKNQEDRGSRAVKQDSLVDVPQTQNTVQTVDKQSPKPVRTFKPSFNFSKRSKQPTDESQPNQLPVPVAEVSKPQQANEQVPVARPFQRLRRPDPDKKTPQYNFNPVQQVQKVVTKEQIVESGPVIEDSKKDGQPDAPRRFTLRKRGEQNEKGAEGYVPSVKEQPTSETIETGVQEAARPTQPVEYNPPARVRGSVKPVQGQPQSPTHNTQNLNPLDTRPESVAIQRPASPPKEVTNYVYNPPKEREGRIKKQKVNLQPAKVSNIYSQAIDLTQQIVSAKEDEPQAKYKHQAEYKQEEPDLHQLLGIKNKSPSGQDDDITFKEKMVDKNKVKRKPQRQEDFFGFDI